MTIELKTVCPEILGQLSAGKYEVTPGCSAKEALLCCIAKAGIEDIDPLHLPRLVYMRNGKHISPETILSDNDFLMVLRPVYGG